MCPSWFGYAGGVAPAEAFAVPVIDAPDVYFKVDFEVLQRMCI